jgi:CBS domain-containing membrane protein
MALIALINNEKLSAIDSVFLIGSFGASSVLIYGLLTAR